MKKKSGTLGLAGKAARIIFQQYHGRIPRQMLRQYVHKFRHERQNIKRYGQRFYNPEVQQEYKKWLSFQPIAKGNRITIDSVQNQDVLSLKNVHTDYVLVIDGDVQFYENMYGFWRQPVEYDLIYSDYDHIDVNGQRFGPCLEPDYSYDTLRGFNYIGPCFAVRTALLKRFEGQPWDPYSWLLNLTKDYPRVKHVSHILYGTTENEKNGYEALKSSLSDVPCVIEHNPDGITNTVHYTVQGEPLVSIIIPTRDGISVLDTCLSSIFAKTTYHNFEIIICDNDSRQMESLSYFSRIQQMHANIHVIRTPGKFNYSRINNLGVEVSHGDYLVLLNNDTSVISENWLEEMLGYVQQKHVGAVGVMMYYPDDTIQHAGVITGKGGTFAHRYYRCPRDIKGYDHTLDIPYNLSCVTAACMMVSRQKFEEVHGFSEGLTVQYNDCDFCLRLYKQGYFNVFLPQVKMYHYESKSRGLDRSTESMQRYQQEVECVKKTWGCFIKHDPFYNDQYDKNYDYRLICGTGSN